MFIVDRRANVPCIHQQPESSESEIQSVTVCFFVLFFFHRHVVDKPHFRSNFLASDVLLPSQQAAPSGLFGLFGKPSAAAPKVKEATPLQPAAGQRGLYLWGGTGTGDLAKNDVKN